MLFDIPAWLDAGLSKPSSFDAVLPDCDSVSAGNMADRKYDAHLISTLLFLACSSTGYVRCESVCSLR